MKAGFETDGVGAMEVGMATGMRYPFWTHDTVAAAVLAGVGMASLQSKLDRVANELNISAVSACVHGWPMLALFAAFGLLLVDSAGESRERERVPSQDNDVSEEEEQALAEAVGDGLGYDEIESAEALLCPGAVEVSR
jgi:hypothetical protein